MPYLFPFPSYRMYLLNHYTKCCLICVLHLHLVLNNQYLHFTLNIYLFPVLVLINVLEKYGVSYEGIMAAIQEAQATLSFPHPSHQSTFLAPTWSWHRKHCLPVTLHGQNSWRAEQERFVKTMPRNTLVSGNIDTWYRRHSSEFVQADWKTLNFFFKKKEVKWSLSQMTEIQNPFVLGRLC